MKRQLPGRSLRVAYALCLLTLTLPALAQDFLREPLRIPMKGAGRDGLEAILVRPAGTERLPLALITHGSAGNETFRLGMAPFAYLPQALEFARRGFAAVIVMRRDYGHSGGEFHERIRQCDGEAYLRAARNSAEDLRAAIAHLATRGDIDATRILAIGESAGGIAVAALTADPPAGLVAAISFAGGLGWNTDVKNCGKDTTADAFGAFGVRSRIPMLWVYSTNDRLFGPDRARAFHQAFTAAGGIAELIEASAFRGDGHALFTAWGAALWTPVVDVFLKRQGLALREQPLPLPAPALTPPPNLSPNGRQAFADYLLAPPHKAFAVSPAGGWAVIWARRTIEEAQQLVLERCKDCRVIVVDDAPVPEGTGAR